MDLVNWMSAAIFIVFAYFYTKKKILPKLALKKAAKAGHTVDAGQAVQTAAIPSPTLTSLIQTGQFSGQTFTQSKPVMCFDLKLINLHEIGSCDGDTFERRISYEANEMLLKFCSRGIVPTLNALMVNDDCLMLYVTYAAP